MFQEIRGKDGKTSDPLFLTNLWKLYFAFVVPAIFAIRTVPDIAQADGLKTSEIPCQHPHLLVQVVLVGQQILDIYR